MTIRLRAFGRTFTPAVGIVLFPGPKILVLVDDFSPPGVW